MIDSWRDGANAMLHKVAEISEEDLASYLETTSLSLSEPGICLHGPKMDGFKWLLRLKYGVRCSSTHGFAGPTLKDVLANFPTQTDLAARLLGVETQIVASEATDLVGDWDLYVLESGTKESQTLSDFDLRAESTKGKSKRIDVRVRTRAYSIEQHGDKVIVKNEQEDSWWPVVTSKCSLSGELLRYNVHFCSLATLQAAEPHKWCKVELQRKWSQEGYEYLDGMEHTRWDSEINWSRREMHFSRGDRGKSRRIQLHRARLLPVAPEGEEDRYEAAKALAKQCRDLYQRIEHIERSAMIKKDNIFADLSITRITALLWADALAQIVQKTFGVAIAPLHSHKAGKMLKEMVYGCIRYTVWPFRSKAEPLTSCLFLVSRTGGVGQANSTVVKAT